MADNRIRFDDTQLAAFQSIFRSFGSDLESGVISISDICTALQSTGQDFPRARVEEAMQAAAPDNTGSVDFNSFVRVIGNLRSGGAEGTAAAETSSGKAVDDVRGAATTTKQKPKAPRRSAKVPRRPARSRPNVRALNLQGPGPVSPRSRRAVHRPNARDIIYPSCSHLPSTSLSVLRLTNIPPVPLMGMEVSGPGLYEPEVGAEACLPQPPSYSLYKSDRQTLSSERACRMVDHIADVEDSPGPVYNTRSVIDSAQALVGSAFSLADGTVRSHCDRETGEAYLSHTTTPGANAYAPEKRDPAGAVVAPGGFARAPRSRFGKTTAAQQQRSEVDRRVQVRD
jgi:hypothetical protein